MSDLSQDDGRWITTNGAHVFLHHGVDPSTSIGQIVKGLKARTEIRKALKPSTQLMLPAPKPAVDKPKLSEDHPLILAAKEADRKLAENQKLTMHGKLSDLAQTAHIRVRLAAQKIGDAETEAEHKALGNAAINAKFNGPKPAEKQEAKPREVKENSDEDAVEATKYLSDPTAESKDLAEKYFESMKLSEPSSIRATGAKEYAPALDAVRELGNYIPSKYTGRGVSIEPNRADKNAEGYYNEQDQSIHLSRPNNKDTARHEFGHHLEDHNPAIGRAAREFFRSRTQGRKPMTDDEKIKAGWGKTSYPLYKGFISPYTSRIYPGSGHTEVISTGLEAWRKNPVAFAKKDPEHFALIHKIMKGAF